MFHYLWRGEAICTDSFLSNIRTVIGRFAYTIEIHNIRHLGYLYYEWIELCKSCRRSQFRSGQVTTNQMGSSWSKKTELCPSEWCSMRSEYNAHTTHGWREWVCLLLWIRTSSRHLHSRTPLRHPDTRLKLFSPVTLHGGTRLYKLCPEYTSSLPTKPQFIKSQ